MTSADIQGACVGYWSHCLWSPNNVLAVPNSTGVVGWEADLLVIQKSDYVHEVEIKISVADFRREFVTKADKHEILQRGRPRRVENPAWSPEAYRRDPSIDFFMDDWSDPQPHLVRCFWFAIPVELLPKIEAEIPAYCGIITVRQAGRDGEPHRFIPRRHRTAPGLKMSRKASDADKVELMRSCYHRFWEMRWREQNKELIAKNDAELKAFLEETFERPPNK